MNSTSMLEALGSEKIIAIISRLGGAPLTTGSHLYSKYGSIPIIEASIDNTAHFSTRFKERPALGLIEVVLSANRNYNQHVLPNIERIEQTSDLGSFDQLTELVTTLTPEEFFKFWGPRDPLKYEVLKKILSAIQELRQKYPDTASDFGLMERWSQELNLRNYKSDLIGKINHVAVATLQHLRMTFGHNTVKPDRRVKQVLDVEFQMGQLNDINSILAVEKIAELSNMSTLTIDQIFVNYGSGYYGDSQPELVDNDFSIWPPYEIFYIESMLTITNTAMADQSMLRTIIENLEDGNQEHLHLVIDLSQNIIHHAAALSRYFWPAQNKGHKKRGQRLRKAFDVEESSALKDKGLRNLIEHFDENLDVYVSKGIAGTILPHYIGRKSDIDLNVTHIFRAFFFDEFKFHVLHHEVELVPIINELIRIHVLLEEARDSGGRLPLVES